MDLEASGKNVVPQMQIDAATVVVVVAALPEVAFILQLVLPAVVHAAAGAG